MMIRNGYARLKMSHISTGLMFGVLGKPEETDKYTEVSSIMHVMFTVTNISQLSLFLKYTVALKLIELRIHDKKVLEMFYLNSTLNFGMPPVFVFQLEVYY